MSIKTDRVSNGWLEYEIARIRAGRASLAPNIPYDMTLDHDLVQMLSAYTELLERRREDAEKEKPAEKPSVTLDGEDFGVFALQSIRASLHRKVYLSRWEDSCVRQNIGAVNSDQLQLMRVAIKAALRESSFFYGFYGSDPGDRVIRQRWDELRLFFEEESARRERSGRMRSDSKARRQ